MVLTQDEARYERATTDENGFFVLCRLPGREELVLQATTSELGIAMTVDGRISRKDLFVDR